MKFKPTAAQIKLALVVIAAILLTCILFRKCDRTPPAKPQPVVVSNEPKLQKEVKQWKDSTSYWKGQAMILLEEKRTSDILIDRADTEITRLIKIHRNFKADKDTVQIVKTCDSLIEINEFLMYEINQYQTDMNTLVEMYDEALRASDSAAIKQTQLNSELRIALNQANAQNAELVKGYNKQLKRAKRERTLGRVLAGAAIVLGGAVLAK